MEKISKIERTFLEMPEVQAGRGMIQNEYHRFDVFDHTIDVVGHLKVQAVGVPILVARISA